MRPRPSRPWPGSRENPPPRAISGPRTSAIAAAWAASAIQVLEFFDKVGLLRRVGDAHKLRADCRLFIDDADGDAARAA